MAALSRYIRLVELHNILTDRVASETSGLCGLEVSTLIWSLFEMFQPERIDYWWDRFTGRKFFITRYIPKPENTCVVLHSDYSTNYINYQAYCVCRMLCDDFLYTVLPKCLEWERKKKKKLFLLTGPLMQFYVRYTHWYLEPFQTTPDVDAAPPFKVSKMWLDATFRSRMPCWCLCPAPCLDFIKLEKPEQTKMSVWRQRFVEQGDHKLKCIELSGLYRPRADYWLGWAFTVPEKHGWRERYLMSPQDLKGKYKEIYY